MPTTTHAVADDPFTDLIQQVDQHTAGLWRHHSERIYQVLTIANRTSGDHRRFPVTVVYQDIVTQAIWSRPLEQFLEKCTPWHATAPTH